jgi:hypothetical protein
MEGFNIFIPKTQAAFERATTFAQECGAFVISPTSLPITSVGSGPTIGLTVGASQTSYTIETAIHGGIVFTAYNVADSMIIPTTLGLRIEAFLAEGLSWFDEECEYSSTMTSLEAILSDRTEMIDFVRTLSLTSEFSSEFYFFSESFTLSLASFDYENVAQHVYQYLKKTLGDRHNITLIE